MRKNTFLRHWQIESRDNQSVGMLVMKWNGLGSNRMKGTFEQFTPCRHGKLDKICPLSGSEGFEENRIGRFCRKSRTSWNNCLLQRAMGKRLLGYEEKSSQQRSKRSRIFLRSH